jgi:hypothetical protein
MLLVALLPVTSSFAQTHQDSIDTYNELNEWAVVKLTIAYIEDLRGFSKTNNPDSKEYRTYLKLIENYPDNSIDVNLDTVGSILTNGDWSKVKAQVFDKYRKDLVDSIDNYNFDSVDLFYKGLKSNIKSQNILKEIQKKYSESLSPHEISEVNNDLKVKTAQKSDTISDYRNKQKNSRGTGNNTFIYIIGGVLLLSIVINLILILKNKDLGKNKKRLENKLKTKREENDKLKFELQKCFGGNRRSPEGSSSELQKLKIENNKLKGELSELKKVDYKKTPKKSDESISTTVEFDTPSQDHVNKIIYLTSPFQDSTFADEDSSDVKTQNTIYQVDFDAQTNLGILSLIQDADYSKALNSPDSYLETACIYDNEYTHNATSVKVTEKGKIRLEGEDWKVIKKVRIKFI